MSAYVCNDNHLLYLVTMAMERPAQRYGFRWRHNGQTHELPDTDLVTAADVANMLLRENIASVSHRYPHESSATLPGPIGGVDAFTPASFCRVWHWDSVQILKSIQCYRYQSCEHPGWETSEAAAFIDSLEKAAIHALPGMDKAEWGAPEPTGRRLIPRHLLRPA